MDSEKRDFMKSRADAEEQTQRHQLATARNINSIQTLKRKQDTFSKNMNKIEQKVDQNNENHRAAILNCIEGKNQLENDISKRVKESEFKEFQNKINTDVDSCRGDVGKIMLDLEE